MAGLLIKIAKEFNVATTTIVDFLSAKGYGIENKPNAKVDDVMYGLLQQEFKGSAVIKEKADQLQIGINYNKKPEEKVHHAPPPPPPPFVKVEAPKPVEPIIEVPATPPTPQPTVVEEEIFKNKPSEPIGLKVVGKIDLNPKKAVEPEPIVEPVVEVSQPVEEKIEAPAPPPVEVPKEVVVEQSPVIEEPAVGEVAPSEESADKEPEDNEFRAKTPQLQGLRILGKIDTNKFGSFGKKGRDDKKAAADAAAKAKDVKKPAAGGTEQKANTGSTPSSAESAEAKKRKRKRKKVSSPVTVDNNNKGAAPGNNSNQDASKRRPGQKPGTPGRDEVKEVSQKEIDDKLKATMARLNMGGKNKRQKIRRDNREIKREKQDQLDNLVDDSVLELTEFVSVSELANIMDVNVGDVITTCMNLGVIVSINQRLDAEVIELVSNEFGFEVKFINADEADDDEIIVEDDPSDLTERAPIVTVMGHVDHGKTSLLDYIRSANVAEGEAGGITQHIGAYEMVVNDRKITFLDTPGHEAFTAMRARGAKVTDIAVIIVAADDQVMPQTKEAISHAQAAGVPIIFAINKIDKDGANPTRIKQSLSEMNLLVEEWGGTIQSQDISAKTGLNIELLTEKILLEADVLELKANVNKPAIGTVIEASLDKGRGYVTKILVQNGTLHIGDPIVAGSHSGKVKAMFNEKGKKVKTAGPSTPVLVLGLSGAPQAGEKFKVYETEQEGRQIAVKRAQIEREQANRASKRISLDEIGRRLALGTFKELNLIVKGDVDGSIEALSDSLIKLSVEKIQVNVIHKAVGQIVESDVLLASASDAIIIGFQVRPSPNARSLAEKEGVQIRSYSIIYEAIEEVKMAMEGMLEPTKQENILGMAEVRETYKISKIGTIAGCLVTEGKFFRSSHIRVIRDGIVVFPTKERAHGEISSLKRFKEDVKEIRNGLECGITIKNFNDIREGDYIEAYEIVEIKTKLE
ncbi:MAG: translation initiation factor IF-2 [Saprospiraceae bacterium]|nr:translation initiation factor IF-2 [Saprospiraceae bacterium]